MSDQGGHNVNVNIGGDADGEIYVSGGDINLGDTIKVGDITGGSGVFIGSGAGTGASVTVSEGKQQEVVDSVQAAFEQMQADIATQLEAVQFDKDRMDAIQANLQMLRDEVARVQLDVQAGLAQSQQTPPDNPPPVTQVLPEEMEKKILDKEKISDYLKILAVMSEDIFEVATITLANPAAGIALVVKKIAAKAREEKGLTPVG